MYRLVLHKKALKYYRSVDDPTALRIDGALDKVAEKPIEGSHIKPLRGRLGGKYRYAVGDLRIVYTVDDAEGIVFIEAIGPRGDVYKR